MKRLSTLISLAVLWLVATLPAAAQQARFDDALLDHMAGHWIAQGTIAGKTVTHDVDAEWVMGHQYLRVHEISRDKDSQGAPTYEATVFVGWDQESSEYVCVWLDVYGGISPISFGVAKPAHNAIPFVFKSDTAEFHTTFEYQADDGSWKWRLDSVDHGKPAPFARLTLTKEEDAHPAAQARSREQQPTMRQAFVDPLPTAPTSGARRLS